MAARPIGRKSDRMVSPQGETEPDARQGIGSVETAAAVLFALEQAGGPLTLNQIAQRCRSQPSKIHRYLVSLGRTGLTTQSRSTGLYDLGAAMRRLGGEALRRTNEIATASEYAAQLSVTTGHSVNLSVWGDSGPMIVRWDYGAHALSLTARVGAALPILSSAAGEVFLTVLPATMTEPVVRRALDSGAHADLDEIRARVVATGYGRTIGGVIAGHYSVSTPIFTAADGLPIAMTMVFPREELDEDEMERSRSLLLKTARTVSSELGYTGDGLSALAQGT